MQRSLIRLLAVDMDGTCVNNQKTISPAVLEALRTAADAGILVVPTTGRVCTCLPYQLMEEKFYRYVISSHGAAATDIQTGEILHKALIPWKKAVGLLRECDENQIGLSVHRNHEFLLQGRFLRQLGRFAYGRDARNTLCVKDLAALVEEEKTDLEELQLFYFRDSTREACRSILERTAGLAMAYDRMYVEIYSPEASRGNALRALARHLGIRQEDIACIGDAQNDLSMFDASGLKFAMENGIPELKERADHVVPSNNDDGVAHAILDWILK